MKRAWEQQQEEVRLRSDLKCEVNSLLALLVITFFAVANFFPGVMWRLRFPFLVLSLSLHAVYYTKNEPVNIHRKQSLF